MRGYIGDLKIFGCPMATTVDNYPGSSVDGLYTGLDNYLKYSTYGYPGLFMEAHRFDGGKNPPTAASACNNAKKYEYPATTSKDMKNPSETVFCEDGWEKHVWTPARKAVAATTCRALASRSGHPDRKSSRQCSVTTTRATFAGLTVTSPPSSATSGIL